MKTMYQQPETIILHTYPRFPLCVGSEGGGTGGSGGGGDNFGGGGGGNPWDIGRIPME